MATERKRPVISDGLPSQLPDIDPEETNEWVDSLDGVIDERGAKRARYIMLRLLQRDGLLPATSASSRVASSASASVSGVAPEAFATRQPRRSTIFSWVAVCGGAALAATGCWSRAPVLRAAALCRRPRK